MSVQTQLTVARRALLVQLGDRSKYPGGKYPGEGGGEKAEKGGGGGGAKAPTARAAAEAATIKQVYEDADSVHADGNSVVIKWGDHVNDDDMDDYEDDVTRDIGHERVGLISRSGQRTTVHLKPEQTGGHGEARAAAAKAMRTGETHHVTVANQKEQDRAADTAAAALTKQGFRSTGAPSRTNAEGVHEVIQTFEHANGSKAVVGRSTSRGGGDRERTVSVHVKPSGKATKLSADVVAQLSRLTPEARLEIFRLIGAETARSMAVKETR